MVLAESDHLGRSQIGSWRVQIPYFDLFWDLFWDPLEHQMRGLDPGSPAMEPRDIRYPHMVSQRCPRRCPKWVHFQDRGRSERYPFLAHNLLVNL